MTSVEFGTEAFSAVALAAEAEADSELAQLMADMQAFTDQRCVCVCV